MQVDEIKKLIGNKLLVFIGTGDFMRIAYENDSDEVKQPRSNEIAYNKHPRVFEKRDLLDIAKTFNIKKIYIPTEFNEEKIILPENLGPYRNHIGSKALETFALPYAKKHIFVIRSTREAAVLKHFVKQKYIVLAKPCSAKQLNVELHKYKINNCTVVPIFTDSDELRTYINNVRQSENVNTYKPLLMDFRDILKRIDTDDEIYCNPASRKIAGKDFSLYFKTEMIKYIKNDLRKIKAERKK